VWDYLNHALPLHLPILVIIIVLSFSDSQWQVSKCGEWTCESEDSNKCRTVFEFEPENLSSPCRLTTCSFNPLFHYSLVLSLLTHYITPEKDLIHWFSQAKTKPKNREGEHSQNWRREFQEFRNVVANCSEIRSGADYVVNMGLLACDQLQPVTWSPNTRPIIDMNINIVTSKSWVTYTIFSNHLLSFQTHIRIKMYKAIARPK
jgi:hypothetical protein